MTTPIINLRVRWQVSAVDVESVAPHMGFAEGCFDIASVSSILMVENPTEQDVKLVLPFPAESYSAEVRLLSTGELERFARPTGGAAQFEQLLRDIGEIPAGQEPMLKEIRELTKDFRTAELRLPAGVQVLRFYSQQVLRPIGGNPKSYELELFAPLAGFILAPSGQVSMSVTVAFPPPYAAPGLTISAPIITSLPDQTPPAEQPSGPTAIAERQIYGWVWRQDPKVTIPYQYA